MQTEYGTRAEELARVIEAGPPFLIRYTWAGSNDPREREAVTEALAACFGARTLGPTQTIENFGGLGETADVHIKYLFWLLKAFDLSLGFTHCWDEAGGGQSKALVHRVTIRVDRSRVRGYVEDD